MINTQSLNLLQSALPVLNEQCVAITSRFYEHLFDSHPSLKNIFNASNQVSGKQQKALASAIIKYIECLDQPSKLGALVNQIAHKHVSLGVIEEQYPIVGETLLIAIKEVLNLEDSDPILAAFLEAYQVLADVLIEAEAALIEGKKNKKNDFAGFKSFRIDRIEQESSWVKSFYFRAQDGSSLPDFTLGQYISVRVKPDHCEYFQIRQYTVSDADNLWISVKKEINGLVSSYLHSLKEGGVVELQSPSGHFVHKDLAQKSVFIAGGVGITPLFSMIKSQVLGEVEKANLMLIHCVQNRPSTIFNEPLTQWKKDGKIHFKLVLDEGDDADHSGYLNRSVLTKWLESEDFTPEKTHVYLCGPIPFMQYVNSLCREMGFSEDSLHYEVFGPSVEL